MLAFFARMLDSSDHTVEAHAVLSIASVLSFIGLATYHVIWLKQAFDPAAFGQGIGYTFAGTGAAAWGAGMQRKAQGDSPS